MGVGAGLYMYDVVVKSSRSLSHVLMSSCKMWGSHTHLLKGIRTTRTYGTYGPLCRYGQCVSASTDDDQGQIWNVRVESCPLPYTKFQLGRSVSSPIRAKTPKTQI